MVRTFQIKSKAGIAIAWLLLGPVVAVHAQSTSDTVTPPANTQPANSAPAISDLPFLPEQLDTQSPSGREVPPASSDRSAPGGATTDYPLLPAGEGQANDRLPNDRAVQPSPSGGGATTAYPERPNAPVPVSSPVDGLPDAVTVLDILRRMPRGPGAGSSSVSSAPRASGPKPKGTVQVSTEKRSTPARVTAVAPGQVFVPRPKQRPPGTPAAVAGTIGPEMREREVIVTLAPGSTETTVEELGRAFGLDGSTLYTSALLGTRVVRFRIRDARSVADVVQQLSIDARVQTSQPNYVFTASQAAAKPASISVPQYAPQKLHLDEAHKIARGKGVKIAVIDTAADVTHPALSGAVTASFDALGETKPEAELHGTAITGIVGARSELMGTAPEASILSVRAFAKGSAASAQSHTLAVLKGLDWAVLNGARVINMSFAGPNDPILGQAIAAAVKQGAVIVAAAGNGGRDAPSAYPGAFPNVIAVTAIDSSDALYKNANRGTYISIAAPGVDIIGAAPKGAYEMSSGTSLAAAHVSGVAALMIEKNPKATPQNIRDSLSKSARPLPLLVAEEIGAGIVDAAGALK
jgi:subtilisin family serine protease